MNKKIMYLWLVIVIMLLSTILLIGYSKRDKTYIELEKKLNKSTLKYLNDKKMIPKVGESSLVFVSNLIEENYIKEDENIKKYCIESIDFTKGIIIDKYIINKKCSDEE